MKIAEMDEHHNEYAALEAGISKMVANREFPAVFSVCEQSFSHIIPAIKFRKKRDLAPHAPEFLSFSIIYRYGPALFEHAVLESLLAFVKSTRLLATHPNRYLEKAEAALEQENIARVLWDRLECERGLLQGDICRELGLAPDSALAVVETWNELGIVGRERDGNDYRLYLRSRLDAEIEGCCQLCGARGRGRRELFFKPVVCRKCGTQGYFHIFNQAAR